MGKRDGRVHFPATAAIGMRFIQKLRGPLARCLHGWQWRGDAWQGHLLRTEDGSGWGRKEEGSRTPTGSRTPNCRGEAWGVAAHESSIMQLSCSMCPQALPFIRRLETKRNNT